MLDLNIMLMLILFKMLIKFIHTLLMLDLIFHLSLIVDLVLPFAMFGHI